MIRDELVTNNTAKLVIQSNEYTDVDLLKATLTGSIEESIIYDSLTSTNLIYDRLTGE
jgi:hypothetical protein